MKDLRTSKNSLKSTIRIIKILALNDFKSRFAGSYLGVLWAFTQPIITVMVYWFVFEKALHAGTQGTKAGINAPYVLWLLGGLVPWFYFSDAWNSATNCFLEYQYLVKKVVFNINILPIVKIISGLFVHFILILFTYFLYFVMRFPLSWYSLQIFYYSFCIIIFVTGLSYITAAVEVLFRDIREVVNILLQIGIWATPIMWNIDSRQIQMPHIVEKIIKLNPMYYITSGYRDSLISKVGFWERPVLGLTFWVITIAVLMIGIFIFRKLKDQFADVL